MMASAFTLPADKALHPLGGWLSWEELVPRRRGREEDEEDGEEEEWGKTTKEGLMGESWVLLLGDEEMEEENSSADKNKDADEDLSD